MPLCPLGCFAVKVNKMKMAEILRDRAYDRTVYSGGETVPVSVLEGCVVELGEVLN